MRKGAVGARAQGDPQDTQPLRLQCEPLRPDWDECVDLGPVQLQSLGGQALSILIWEPRH